MDVREEDKIFKYDIKILTNISKKQKSTWNDVMVDVVILSTLIIGGIALFYYTYHQLMKEWGL